MMTDNKTKLDQPVFNECDECHGWRLKITDTFSLKTYKDRMETEVRIECLDCGAGAFVKMRNYEITWFKGDKFTRKVIG